jgi:hypothetical protein
MSTRPTQHPGRSAALTLGACALFTGVVGGVAAADPPAADRDPCELALAATSSWPGSMSHDGNEIRLVSDAFVSYRSHQGGCTPDPTAR